jgi:hypothetical protein
LWDSRSEQIESTSGERVIVGDLSNLFDISNQPPLRATLSGRSCRCYSPVAHLTEPVGGCGGGPVTFLGPRCLRHLCKQLRGGHLEGACALRRLLANTSWAGANGSTETNVRLARTSVPRQRVGAFKAMARTYRTPKQVQL